MHAVRTKKQNVATKKEMKMERTHLTISLAQAVVKITQAALEAAAGARELAVKQLKAAVIEHNEGVLFTAIATLVADGLNVCCLPACAKVFPTSDTCYLYTENMVFCGSWAKFGHQDQKAASLVGSCDTGCLIMVCPSCLAAELAGREALGVTAMHPIENRSYQARFNAGELQIQISDNVRVEEWVKVSPTRLEFQSFTRAASKTCKALDPDAAFYFVDASGQAKAIEV